MKIAKKRRLVALLGIPLLFAFAWFGFDFAVGISKFERPEYAAWWLLGTLVAIMLWMSWLGRIQQKEDDGAIRCTCGGVLVAIRYGETKYTVIGKCLACNAYYEVTKKLPEGNSDGEERSRTG